MSKGRTGRPEPPSASSPTSSAAPERVRGFSQHVGRRQDKITFIFLMGEETLSDQQHCQPLGAKQGKAHFHNSGGQSCSAPGSLAPSGAQTRSWRCRHPPIPVRGGPIPSHGARPAPQPACGERPTPRRHRGGSGRIRAS